MGYFSEACLLVNVIAKYIYHDYDPKLPTLAVIVLQKLCAVSICLPSIRFCFLYNSI